MTDAEKKLYLDSILNRPSFNLRTLLEFLESKADSIPAPALLGFAVGELKKILEVVVDLEKKVD